MDLKSKQWEMCMMPESAATVTHAPTKKMNGFSDNIQVEYSTKLMALTHCLIRYGPQQLQWAEGEPSRVAYKAFPIRDLQKTLEGSRSIRLSPLSSASHFSLHWYVTDLPKYI